MYVPLVPSGCTYVFSLDFRCFWLLFNTEERITMTRVLLRNNPPK